ncbi:O-acetyltransferase [Mycena maculata]|uniref:O-acetyltransferase n=1 Tax=Mycena maculata TaxID=230809 RepID=A0AAD7KE38_9AGAR|nr:O-acetyltransferase [Mycena maculata]
MHLAGRSGIFACVLSVLAVLTRYALFDRFDPFRCGALMHQGTWLDRSLMQWQPHGCMLHHYTPNDGATCLESRELSFIGDSVTRSLFFQFGQLLDPSLPGPPLGADNKHQDQSLQTASGTRLLFFWDPFLNGSSVQNIITLPSNESPQKPALLVIGAGLWYLRYSDRSGGLAAYESRIEFILKSFIRHRSQPAADEIIILPVEEIIPSKLSYDRAISMHYSDVDAMNSDLIHRINPATVKYLNLFTSIPPPAPVHLPLVFNQMLDPADTEDGLHFSDSVVRAQANILLNLRCNDHLPKTPPMDKTCCRRYPWPGAVQLMILTAAILWGPYAMYASRLSTTGQWVFQGSQRSALVISVSIALIYSADRTALWLKEKKSYSPLTFAGLCLVLLAVGLGTVKRGDKDLGFLNREQTDEWKGWMQGSASRISGIYNPIRVLVAAYLFMTGYGHTSFYLLKADYGFTRVARVLIRTNLFTLLLTYTMGTDWLFYYFSPLVSLWFCIIHATMAIGSRLNDRTPVLLCKILCSAGLVSWFMTQSWPLETIFRFLRQFLGINWSAREWGFRVNLDLYIVYIGQLTALAVIKIREDRLTEHRYWSLLTRLGIAVSAGVLLWFFSFELMQESKFTYNTWHPWISWLPVLAFVILRNANATLRSASSQAFAFIGTCSLETFIIQYHFFLAADTKGVLVIIPGIAWRPLNFVVTSTAFVYVSHLVAEAITDVTKRACETPEALPNPVTVPQEHPAPLALQDELQKTELGKEERGAIWQAAEILHTRLGGLKGRLAFVAMLMWIANLAW